MLLLRNWNNCFIRKVIDSPDDALENFYFYLILSTKQNVGICFSNTAQLYVCKSLTLLDRIYVIIILSFSWGITETSEKQTASLHPKYWMKKEKFEE